MLSLEELLYLNEAGTVDFGFSCHASFNTCLIACPTDVLFGLLGIRNLGLGSTLGLILGMPNLLERLTGLGSNLSTGFDVLEDLLDSVMNPCFVP